MKICWIFPQNKLCGISFYSHKYVAALEKYADILCVDPGDVIDKKAEAVSALRQSDIVHIQYETSFYLKHYRDCYPNVCAAVTCPIVVTLHEVYDQFPGVYPRESITGGGLVRAIKERIYDARHPYVTALTKHSAAGFFADALFVHSAFQREILLKKGVLPEKIIVLPFPISPGKDTPELTWGPPATVHFAATGFINDSYDFDLLMETLAKCKMPWEFTWIGGIRRPDDRLLFNKIQNEIERRNWAGRFTITGEVTDQTRDDLLNAAHVYLALFKYKSSSESLSVALGSRRLIVATELPLTREMNAEFPVMLLTAANAPEIAGAIERIITDAQTRSTLWEAMRRFTEKNSYDSIARRLTKEYERVLRK
jgi:glycosyltransferase involved in cell wall biosynthesis